MPSVASEVSASQQSRVQQSNVRNRADSSDRSQNSPFSEMLDSTAPVAEPRPTPSNARTEKGDATRPADKNGKTDAPADRTPSFSTKDASAVADAVNVLGNLGSRIAVDGLGVFGGSGKGGKSGIDATAPAGSDDGTTTAATDTDAAAKPDADIAPALQPMVVDLTKPVVAADVTIIAAPPSPAIADAPALHAATASSDVPQIEALIAVQAAEQPAASANAAENQAVAADEAKPANGSNSDDLKTDAKGKKEIKADAKALTQAKAEATADAKAPAAQPQFRQDADAEPQNAGKAADDVRQNAAAPAGENPETASRGLHAADAAGAAKAGAAPHQNAGAAGAAASPDVAAAATAASAAAPGANAAEPPPQVLTPAHIQAQLQGQIQSHIQGQIQGRIQGQMQGHADTAAAIPLSGVAVEIATQASVGKQHFEIRLDPPELGRIDVKLDIDSDGNATTRLVVERTETLDLLKRDAHQLERALQQAGLKTSDNAMEFSLHQQFARSDDQGSSNTAKIVVPDEEAAPFPAQRQSYGRLLGTGSGLDIRV